MNGFGAIRFSTSTMLEYRDGKGSIATIQILDVDPPEQVAKKLRHFAGMVEALTRGVLEAPGLPSPPEPGESPGPRSEPSGQPGSGPCGTPGSGPPE